MDEICPLPSYPVDPVNPVTISASVLRSDTKRKE
jgi:hypothetical protein